MTNKVSDSGYYKNQPNPGNLVSRLSLKVRKKIFHKLMEISGANSETKVLDVGVTNDKRDSSNFLEKMYPYPENITTVGLEDASFLTKEYPGLTYIKANGMNLPFIDKSFDLVTSFAVIEHVGNRQNQRRYVQELCRVGKSCLITTPNRWYPMEVHTMIPIIHWLPPVLHRNILKIIGKTFYAEEKNLNLLDSKTLQQCYPEDMKVHTYHNRLLGIVSNLIFYAKSR